MNTRRTFILKSIPLFALAATAYGTSQAQSVKIEESDATAKALGYRHDASKVDAKKSPTYAAGRNCANCVLFQGKTSDSWAPCGAMGGKQVNAKGWCTAWSKKA